MVVYYFLRRPAPKEKKTMNLIFLIFLFCINFNQISSKCGSSFHQNGNDDSEAKKYFIENFKNSWLKELNLVEPPVISPSAKKAIIAQLKMVQKRDGHNFDLDECSNQGRGSGRNAIRKRRQIQLEDNPVLDEVIAAKISETKF